MVKVISAKEARKIQHENILNDVNKSLNYLITKTAEKGESYVYFVTKEMKKETINVVIDQLNKLDYHVDVDFTHLKISWEVDFNGNN